MCFDAKTIDECKKPQPLRPGQTVFFVIQPRFMNVDIRIIVDVTQGELDLFMSPQDDSFVVLPNQTTGDQDIYLDSRYIWFPENEAELIQSIGTSPSRFDYDNTTSDEMREDSGPFRPHTHDCHPLIMQGFSVKDKHAKDLSTYVTLNNCNILLRVYGLQNRLVLTVSTTSQHESERLKINVCFHTTGTSDGAQFKCNTILYSIKGKERNGQLRFGVFPPRSIAHRFVCVLLRFLFLLLPIPCRVCRRMENKTGCRHSSSATSSRCGDAAHGKASICIHHHFTGARLKFTSTNA